MSWFGRNRRGQRQAAAASKVATDEGKPISAESQLFWNEYLIPANAAVANMNNAFAVIQNMLAKIVLEREGYDYRTHALNLDSMRIVRKPDAPMDERGHMVAADQSGG